MILNLTLKAFLPLSQESTRCEYFHPITMLDFNELQAPAASLQAGFAITEKEPSS